MMNLDLIQKMKLCGNRVFMEYVKSIASGDGSVFDRMASSVEGARSPFDNIDPKLKKLGQKIAAELPNNWNEEMIAQAVVKELNLTPQPTHPVQKSPKSRN